MPPSTLHGVGVINKPYLVIFAEFKESMTLNLAQRSFEVIHFSGTCTTLYKAVNSNFRSIFNRFGDTAGFVHTEPIFFHATLLFRLKFGGVPFGIDP